MSEELNAVEVFEVAERIEARAAEYYRQGAEIVKDEPVCDLLEKLAVWEDGHELIFRGMKEAVQEGRLDLHPAESGEYKSIAALSSFAMESNPARDFSDKTTVLEVLSSTLRKERGSVKYYRALLNFVADAHAAEQIERIVCEENKHIELVQEAIDGLSKRKRRRILPTKQKNRRAADGADRILHE